LLHSRLSISKALFGLAFEEPFWVPKQLKRKSRFRAVGQKRHAVLIEVY